MKQTKTLMYWSGLTALVSLFVVTIAWSILPLYGKTLPHWIEQTWDIKFLWAAMLSSLASALLAVGTMSLSLLTPASESTDSSERSQQ